MLTFCVAEKPSVAKAIAELLSRGNCRKVIYLFKFVVSREIKIQSNLWIWLQNKQLENYLPCHIGTGTFERGWVSRRM